MAFQHPFGSLGAGHMAEAVVAAALRAGLWPASGILVSDPQPDRRTLFTRRFGVDTTADNARVVSDCACVMIAVKPQAFPGVAQELRELFTAGHLVVSIMAGVSAARVAGLLGGRPRVVRVMPNLPIMVGAGMSGLWPGPSATPEDVDLVRRLFDAGGETLVVSDESLIDAVTAVSGSGPAYFYAFVEAVAAGGAACGLTEAEALRLARAACLGAARMMIQTGEPPAELRRKVTSRGGTTQAALEHLETCGADRAIRDAVVAAFRRARELGG